MVNDKWMRVRNECVIGDGCSVGVKNVVDVMHVL